MASVKLVSETAGKKPDKKMIKKINELIKVICRTPFSGTGKPEPFKHKYKGYWSRRITDEHRPIYKVIDNDVWVAKCRFHYD